MKRNAVSIHELRRRVNFTALMQANENKRKNPRFW